MPGPDSFKELVSLATASRLRLLMEQLKARRAAAVSAQLPIPQTAQTLRLQAAWAPQQGHLRFVTTLLAARAGVVVRRQRAA